mmetsp:Transcript_30499/g.50347  ORF Transcript_30499/g.50347 Transcript_30499/m.50347 type:complete len:602 (+) Transcript_30499:87-1892(+)
MKVAFLLTALLIPSIESSLFKRKSKQPPALSDDSADTGDACTIFLAPSTIEGAGLGIFTSIARENNTVLGVSDVIIPIYDLRWHHPDDDKHFIFTEYVWDGAKMMGMHADTENDLVEGYAPGLDCAINCHLGLLNVDRGFPAYDTTLPHRSKYPGAGSMTAYINSSTSTTVDLPAGAELFKFYGDDWFKSRSHFPNIPLSLDYERAHNLMDRMDNLFNNRWKLSKEAQQDLYQITVSVESRTLNALPPNFHQMEGALTNGLRSISQPQHIRDNVKDMPEARCLESIVPGQSAIDGAGRGAFTARSFKQGHVITGSPLLHVPDRDVMNLYHWDSTNRLKDPDRIVGKQIVINYCFGHPDTPLVLCPYGSGVNYINHSREKANVKIQWAPHGHIGQDDGWFDWSVKKMMTTHQPNLAWDYVALRDIKKGEELYMDYGDDWVDAWEQHVAAWKPDDFVDYKSAAEWNQLLKDDDIRTHDEQLENPYPSNVQLVCHTAVKSNSYKIKQRRLAVGELWDITMDGIPCRIVQRKNDAKNITNYTVEVTGGRGGTVERTKVYRKMFRFRDLTYSTDIHLSGAFRKEAIIPDAMLPAEWRTNTRQNDEL